MLNLLKERLGNALVNVNKHIAHWLHGADEAWQNAEWLLKGKRYSFAAFAAHLALEKALKAHVTKATADIPPRTHDLKHLAKLSGLTLSAEQVSLLGAFNEYQLEGRYPEFAAPPLDPEVFLHNLESAKDFYAWLKQQS